MIIAFVKRHRRVAAVATATLAMVAISRPALCAQAVSSCGTTIESTSAYLTNDLTVTTPGANCLAIPSGRNLDLSGHDIICDTSDTGDCGVAIKASASGTRITGSSTAHITGTSGESQWTIGVAGALEVSDVHIWHVRQAIVDENVDTATRVDWAKKIENNTFYCTDTSGEPCVDVWLSRATDTVIGNQFTGGGGTDTASFLKIEGRDGSTGPTLSDNEFVYCTEGQCCIEQAQPESTKDNRFRAFDNDFPYWLYVSDTYFCIESTVMLTDRCDDTKWDGNSCQDDFWCGSPPDSCTTPECPNEGTVYCMEGVPLCTD